MLSIYFKFGSNLHVAYRFLDYVIKYHNDFSQSSMVFYENSGLQNLYDIVRYCQVISSVISSLTGS